MNTPIQTTIADIVDLLNERVIPFALIGGLAVMVRGETRVTVDVDIVAGIDVDKALELLAMLGTSLFMPLFDDVEEIITTAFIMPLRHKNTQVKVDLAIGLSGFERQLIKRATKVEMSGVSIPVATAEDLLVMKVFAERPRDMEDAQRIVQRQGAALDWDYVLEVGGELQHAVSQDIVRQLLNLRDAGDTS